MRYRETGELHLDFHGAANTTINYIANNFGKEALHEIFFAVGQKVYKSIHEKLKQGDASELIEHWQYFFSREWRHSLANWHRFNIFYTHYLRVEGRRVKLLNCPSPCEHGYPRQVVENSPSDIVALCPQNQADPIQLKFRDILIYSLRREAFHQVLCTALKINFSGDCRKEHAHVWHLGDHSGTEVYLTYEISTLTDTISSLYLSQQKPFILMVPTAKNVTPEIQQFIVRNSSLLFSMADELHLQTDGSFRAERNIPECMKSSKNYTSPGSS